MGRAGGKCESWREAEGGRTEVEGLAEGSNGQVREENEGGRWDKRERRRQRTWKTPRKQVGVFVGGLLSSTEGWPGPLIRRRSPAPEWPKPSLHILQDDIQRVGEWGLWGVVQSGTKTSAHARV